MTTQTASPANGRTAPTQATALRERLIDILLMSPMADHISTSLAPVERTAEEIIDALGLSDEWGVAVEALGDLLPGAPGPEPCPSEANARHRVSTSDDKWTHGNPVSLHRRVVGTWDTVEPGIEDDPNPSGAHA